MVGSAICFLFVPGHLFSSSLFHRETNHNERICRVYQQPSKLISIECCRYVKYFSCSCLVCEQRFQILLLNKSLVPEERISNNCGKLLKMLLLSSVTYKQAFKIKRTQVRNSCVQIFFSTVVEVQI